MSKKNRRKKFKKCSSCGLFDCECIPQEESPVKKTVKRKRKKSNSQPSSQKKKNSTRRRI
jgi:hypothetical protein